MNVRALRKECDMDDCGGLISKTWEVIKQGYLEGRESYPALEFHEENFQAFEGNFEKRYNDIIKKFMRPDTKALDSHKQAAIITVSCLESKIINHPLEDDNKISIVPQLIAVNAGLSYMADCLNEVLKREKIEKKIDKYYLPVAMTCDTPYQEIMCRLLYYEQDGGYGISFNVLELADRYFLLEYINLLQYGIEPSQLKRKE